MILSLSALHLEMARYQVILAYDGTGYQGFQKQAQVRTVQDVVENALRNLNWSGAAILASGRTDAGVHAAGQVIAFDLEWGHSPSKLLRALNSHLPADMAARDIRVVRPEFHPRYDAISRCYRYHLICDPLRRPLEERFAWRVWPAADLSRLQAVASMLVGTHDFSAFGTPPKPGGKTVRTISRAEWFELGNMLVFEIASQAFLYHMVRRLVSFQVEIAQGHRELNQLAEYLEMPTGEMVPGLAPAQGLVLAKVSYDNDRSGNVEPAGLDSIV